MAGNLTRYDPLNDIARFEPVRGFEDIFRAFGMPPALRGAEAEPKIRMDVTENEQSYSVKAEVPGVKKEDIHVEINGNRVSIRAEMKSESEGERSGNVVRSERYYGQQYRSFTLPQELDESQAEAHYQDGILELTLPKKAGGGGRRLDIH